MMLDRAVGRSWPPGKRSSKLVFIGRGLDASELCEELTGCVVESVP